MEQDFVVVQCNNGVIFQMELYFSCGGALQRFGKAPRFWTNVDPHNVLGDGVGVMRGRNLGNGRLFALPTKWAKEKFCMC